MNEILLKRICHLIAITYALSKEDVWEIYQKKQSLDETLKLASKIG